MIGGPAGMLAGAAAGAGLGAVISSAVASIASSIGGMIGSALELVGTAFKTVGEGIGTIISSVSSVLNDLISTGSRFARAASSNSIAGGLSLQAGSASATMARVLMGDPGGMAGFYANFSNQSPFLRQKQQAFGVYGVNPDDPASLLTAGLARYQENGRRFKWPEAFIQQRVAMDSLYGPIAPQMGAIFQAGPSVVQELVKVIRENTLSAKQTTANLIVGAQLEGIGMQFDMVKMQLLGALMPLIQQVMPAISKAAAGFGDFMTTKFPGLLHRGIDALFGFGQAVAGSLPQVFSVLTEFLMGLVILSKKVAGMIAPLVSSVSPTLGRGLTEFSHMPLSAMGLAVASPPGPPLSGQAAKEATSKRDQYQGYITDLQAGRGGAQSEGQRKLLIAKYESLKAEQEAKLKGSSSETDEGDVANMKNLPAFKTVQDFSDRAKETLGKWKVSADHALDAVHYDNTYSRNRPETQVVEVHIHQHDNPDSITRLETRVVNQAGRQFVRSMQHSN